MSAVRFDAEGEIADAYRILEGSTSNCAGGPTPWGTWLTCEEPLDKRGRVWECDPTGATEAVVHDAMGIWNHEAAAVDPEGEAVYLTEDDPAGLLYRYTPAAYPDLSEGHGEVVRGRAECQPVREVTHREREGTGSLRIREGDQFDREVFLARPFGDGPDPLAVATENRWRRDGAAESM